MPSAIDATKPVDGVNAAKNDLRNNLAAARDEIEALQDQIVSIPVGNIDATGTPDATTALLGNGTWGAVDPALVNSGERTAGTETAARSFSPNDIRLMIGIHAPGASTTSPFTNTTGSMAGAASGLSRKLTGNVTAVPVTDGWIAKFVNTSGTNKTITPASGTCIRVETGDTAASVTLGNNKSCIGHGDGTNLIIEGDVS